MLGVLGGISAVLAFAAFIPYIHDIVRGAARPQRASWFIWSALGAIAVFSQLAEGALHSLWLPAVEALGVFVIFLLSIKYGMGGLGRQDIAALSVAALGLLLWYLTEEAAIALYAVIAADLAGGYLTVAKAYRYPDSETALPWCLTASAAFFACLSVGTWDLVLLSYPLYIAVINLSVVAAMALGRKTLAREA